ncbi:hypothetical protein CPB85DRAFT_1457146 [Mucidula mucida]|nr:hypothetical protein CPB85DRAFT_1457146 [Mucidula mucida]
MKLTGFKPMIPGTRMSPTVFMEAPEIVQPMSIGTLRPSWKTYMANQSLQPITRPFTSPFASTAYPPDTDVPVVRAAKCVARLGRPKKLKLMKKQGCLDEYPPSPLYAIQRITTSKYNSLTVVIRLAKSWVVYMYSGAPDLPQVMTHDVALPSSPSFAWSDRTKEIIANALYTFG